MKYFLFMLSMLTFPPLLPASPPNQLLLGLAISQGNTEQALHYIEQRAADYIDDYNVHMIVTDSRKLILPFLALAVFYNQPVIVSKLLERGHSPYEIVSIETITEDPNKSRFSTQTTLSFARNLQKNAIIKILEKHQMTLPHARSGDHD